MVLATPRCRAGQRCRDRWFREEGQAPDGWRPHDAYLIANCVPGG